MVRLLFLVAVVYSLFQIAPVYINNYWLEDAMQQEARFAGAQHKRVEQVLEDIYGEILKLGIPARREDLQVEERPGGFHIAVEYTVPVSLFHFQLTLRFHPSADSNSI